MSSPMLNNVILCGSMLTYIEVLVSAIDYGDVQHVSQSGSICTIRSWLMSLGFTLLFGGLFSKTYRVYIVFRDHKLRSKFIKDYHLLVMVGGLSLVDCLILVPWTALFPLHKERLVITATVQTDIDTIYSDVYLYCDGKHMTYWQSTLYVYKGFLLVFGTFLAWETRKVTVTELNDSKYIGACIYNVVIVCLFGVPIIHVLPIEQKTLIFVLEACLIIFSTSICQCIIFVPKIQARNENQNKVFDVTSTLHNANRQGGTMTSEVSRQSSYVERSDQEVRDEENVELLKERLNKSETENKRLRRQIASETIAIAKLKRSITALTGDIHIYRTGEDYVVSRTRIQSDDTDIDNERPTMPYDGHDS